MSYVTTPTVEKKQAVKLYYKDYGEGQPVILVHGWPLSNRMWEFQLDDLVNAGYRVITYDRRGFGKSSQPWNGYTYQDFADDLYEVICSLELSNVILVGFSMGGGELATYVEKYGTSKLCKLVFLSSVTPYMLKTDDNPDGVDGSVFEDMKAGIAEDRAGFFADFGKTFVNFDKNQDRISKAQVDFNWYIACRASRKATLDCVDAFGKTDFREGCKQIDIPTLVVHGDEDAVVPMEVSGKRAADIIPDAEFKVIKGAPHGLMFTHNKELNPILIDFFNKE